MGSVIFASHYVIGDILQTIDRGDLDEICRVCEKYVSRYKSDDDLFVACNRILFEKKAGVEVLSEVRGSFEKLFSSRFAEGSGGTNIRFSDRRKNL
jgi:hypothetical protein